ncbi:hypothetical protein MLD38_030331 [Melastoma candidum]|uniref:Uncharacterized protein n=1 Tax=Melastoma candidum TaxID=119954 RepID=A0ACB9MMV9_9MYRT|nr:hypothetical protein MLD38_030331 [Melastoma candidum]
MFMLINCSNCRTPLQLPPGADSIRCAICHSVTLVADPSGFHHRQQQQQHRPQGGNYYPPPFSPSPYGHALPGPPPSAHGSKRALICGISYRNTPNELKGCINDARCMKYLLVNRFRFPESSILMLSEEEADPLRHPTKHNMRMAMQWLVQGCRPGDSLVFHYSGHGSQQRNYTGDEVDGLDETLCPSDFRTQGMIVDDEINAVMVRPLTPGVKLHAIVDACHSGTVLDLPYLCRMDRSGQYVWVDESPPSGTWKGTSGGEAICFSGCDDSQTSADTAALSRVTSTGAMTYAFIQAIERGHGSATYGVLINEMRATIRNANTGTGDMDGGLVTSLISMLLTGGPLSTRMKQEPQLSSNQQFDVYRKPFSL